MNWSVNATAGLDTLPDTITQGLGKPLREVKDVLVQSLTLRVTDDAGAGTASDDLNSTDFTSQTGDTFATILPNDIVTIIHKAVSYSYVGPKPVTVGLGGSYTVFPADFVALGTADHNLLSNLALADQHPQGAITNLLADQAAQDQLLVDHVAAPDPHPVYILDTEVRDNFVGAGYGGIRQTLGQALGTVAATPVLLQFDTARFTTPRFVTQDLASNALQLVVEGVWLISINLIISFTSTNAGRTIQVQLWNLSLGAQETIISVFAGRNQDGVNFNATVPFSVSAAKAGDFFQLRLLSSSDSFSNANFNLGSFDAIHVSEFKGAL